MGWGAEFNFPWQWRKRKREVLVGWFFLVVLSLTVLDAVFKSPTVSRSERERKEI